MRIVIVLKETRVFGMRLWVVQPLMNRLTQTLQSLRTLIFRKLRRKQLRDLAATMLLFIILLLKTKYAICLVFCHHFQFLLIWGVFDNLFFLKIYRKTYGKHVGFAQFMDSWLHSLMRKVNGTLVLQF